MGLSGKQNLRLCESYFPEHFRIIIGCVKIIEAHFNLKQKSSGTVDDENELKIFISVETWDKFVRLKAIWNHATPGGHHRH